MGDDGVRRRRNGVGDQATQTSTKERYAMNENRVVPFDRKMKLTIL